MPRKKTVKDQLFSVLQTENKELHTQLAANKRYLAEQENLRLKLSRAKDTAEDDREILYDVVRILADQVTAKTAAGRKAREEARKLLEKNKIAPPSTLGSSRNRKPLKRNRPKTA